MVSVVTVRKPRPALGPTSLVAPDKATLDRMWRSRPVQRVRRAYEAGDQQAVYDGVKALDDNARVLAWCMFARLGPEHFPHIHHMVSGRTGMLIVEAVQRLRTK